MIKSSPDPYSELKELIEGNTQKELKCRKYLCYVPHILFKEFVTDIIYSDKEYRTFSGDSDYVISGIVKEESGISYPKAYIWELKAPQCFIFKRERGGRLSPTSDLFEAENQLLNYYHDILGQQSFLDTYRVAPQNVQAGGIIIGCNKTTVKGKFEELKRDELYEKAIKIRQYFYKSMGIRLLTWDYVLANIESVKHDGETKESLEIRPISTSRLPIGTLRKFGW